MNKVKGGKIWNLFNIELTEQAKRLNDTWQKTIKEKVLKA
jgi:hypothetical protein